MSFKYINLLGILIQKDKLIHFIKNKSYLSSHIFMLLPSSFMTPNIFYIILYDRLSFIDFFAMLLMDVDIFVFVAISIFHIRSKS